MTQPHSDSSDLLFHFNPFPQKRNELQQILKKASNFQKIKQIQKIMAQIHEENIREKEKSDYRRKISIKKSKNNPEIKFPSKKMNEDLSSKTNYVTHNMSLFGKELEVNEQLENEKEISKKKVSSFINRSPHLNLHEKNNFHRSAHYHQNQIPNSNNDMTLVKTANRMEFDLKFDEKKNEADNLVSQVYGIMGISRNKEEIKNEIKEEKSKKKQKTYM
jgi:hypothetical protein